MKGIRIFFNYDPSSYLTFNKVEHYKLKKNFIIMKLLDGKCIAYNLDSIYKFEVEGEDW